MTQSIDPQRTALFLDIDGTILNFAATPEAVVVEPGLVQLLRNLHFALGGALAFVSGRTIQEIDRLFEPLRFAAAGVHGAELRLAPAQQVRTTILDVLPESLWQRLISLVESYPGVFVENKIFAFAVHFRNAPQFKAALASAVEALELTSHDASLSILHGHGVIEIKRRAYEKGMAIDLLMQQPAFAGREPIFVGDDTTDLPGFAAVLRHGGSAYCVGRPIEGLTGSFATPEAVRAWLAQMSQSFEPPL